MFNPSSTNSQKFKDATSAIAAKFELSGLNELPRPRRAPVARQSEPKF